MPKPKSIINNPSDAVIEFIEGLTFTYPNNVVTLANHNVVLAANRSATAVQIVSGGGSGHEPSHAGWLGTGMLSAAVCGGIFASPSISSVLAAIRAVATPGGVLVIVKNYTGDRLNFGMAVERANQEGISCTMVVVSDDCAIPRTKGITGARGVAGTVLVHKVAGAAATAGKSLEEVARLSRLVNRRMGSLGVALDSVTVPGAEQVNDRLDEHTIEIGLGIHGEAGSRQSPLLSADEIAREMITTINSYGRVKDDDSDEIVPVFNAGDEICVLVNNLGGTSNFEMSILVRSCVTLLESNEFGARATRVMVGSYMTSFAMHGVSLTILNVSDQTEVCELLDAPTSAPAWAPCDVWKTESPRRSMTEVPEIVFDEHKKEETLPELLVADFDSIAKSLTKAAVQNLAEAENLLTKYDTVVGDGDCGMTMTRGAAEILNRLDEGILSTDHPVSLFSGLADAVSTSMGGTSGILLELMFRKMASTLNRDDTIGVPELCQALQAGVDAVCFYGGAQLGSRTMLDALIPAAKALCESETLSEAAHMARLGADGTAAMSVASAGRSNYLSEDTLAGTPDPGAIAVAIVLESLVSASSKPS
jgi:triose/dihydroxyacetone kinase / FAD-AMP lyase (cyclizing)